MSKKSKNSVTVIIAIAAILAISSILLMQRQGAAKSPNGAQSKERKLRDIAMERDVEVQGVDGSHLKYVTLESLIRESEAVVYGRIVDFKSFFADSGSPLEYGEVITTEYSIDVLRVIKDRTMEVPLSKASPAQIATPLKIARNGGAVYVNGHRASVKVEGYESLTPGRRCLFFLRWSPDYNAYLLTNGIAGAVLVNDDLSLTSLGSSKDIQAKLSKANLDTFLTRIK